MQSSFGLKVLSHGTSHSKCIWKSARSQKAKVQSCVRNNLTSTTTFNYLLGAKGEGRSF